MLVDLDNDHSPSDTFRRLPDQWSMRRQGAAFRGRPIAPSYSDMRQRSLRTDPDPYVSMMFRQMPGAMWATDGDLRLTYVAGRLTRNIAPRARPGMFIFDVVGSRDAAHPMIARHRAALAGESQSFEYRLEGRWYEVFIEQLTNEAGEPTGCIAAAFDVTEQRAIRDRLERSEALLVQAQRVAHIGSFDWNIASGKVTWSDELNRIYGLAPGQVVGTYEQFLTRVHPDDLERTKSRAFDALRKGGPFVDEYRIVRSDSSVRVLHTRGEIIKDQNGKAVRVAGCSWDITEQKKTLSDLERARSMLEATIEATADGLLVVDRNGRVTAYNERFLSLWRIPAELACQGEDTKLLAYVADQLEDPDRFIYSTRELYGHPERESFDVHHFKDGRVYERYSTPQRIGDRIAGRVWSFHDVTEYEKLLRRALFLADATRLLSSLDVEPALDSVARLAIPFLGEGCAIDLVGNGQPRRLLVVSKEGSESFSPSLHSAVMAGHSTIYSMGVRSCMAVPLVVKGAVAGAMTFIGPPRRRYDEQDLEFAETLAQRAALSVENARVYQEAQEALRARDEFLSMAAHEIRGPITSVHMAVQGLKQGKVASEVAPRLYEIIEREDRRLVRFVNELLELGRIQGGGFYFNFEEVDLGDIVRDASSRLGAEITRSGSSLSITTEGRPIGHWDRVRLDQVVSNLLLNAINFGLGNPIAVSVKEIQGLSTIEVRDQGIGIPAEMQDRIFNPFQRAVSARNYGGLGLGLFIVRTIVEGLGGTVRVESQPEIGSTFVVELPSGSHDAGRATNATNNDR